MSWLNNSLNSLKGTITNLAQEVLSEHDQIDETSTEQQHQVDAICQLEILEESQRKIDELSSLCGIKDNEIALLRKQINDQQNKIIETDRSSKSPIINKDGGGGSNNDPLEDSWCWELDNVPSSGSSSGGGEMINIPLDQNTDVTTTIKTPTTTTTTNTNKKNQQKIKKLQNENQILNEKISKLENDNENLNKNLDELDKQQQQAIDNLLLSKNEIHEKLKKILDDNENDKKSLKKKDKKLQKCENDLENLTKKFENLQNSYTIYVEENLKLKTKLDENDKKLQENTNENLLLKNLLDEKEKQLIELIEKVENDFGNEREEENVELKKKLQLLTEQLEELENGNLVVGSSVNVGVDDSGDGDKKLLKKKNITGGESGGGDSSSSTSSSGKQSEDEFIVLEDENSSANGNGQNWEQKFNELLSDKSKNVAKIIDLEKFITELETNINLLEIENKNILDKFELSKKKLIEYDELKQKNNKLQEQFDIINTEYLDYQDEQTALQKELNEKNLILEDQILDLQDKNLTLDNENQEYITKIDLITQSKLQENFNNLQIDNEKLQNNLLISNEKYYELENDMKMLNIKYENKIADLENEVKILIKSRGNSPDNNMSISMETSDMIDKYKLENDNLNQKINELNELIKKCELNASDVESKLMMENVDLQKKLIDLEMTTTTTTKQETSSSSLKEETTLSQEKSNDDNTTTTTTTVDFNILQNLFSIYVENNLLITNNHDELESAFKIIKDRIWKINILEKNLKQMSDEITNFNEERSSLLHKIDTLKADNENYKIECNELTKNNGVLLDELDNYYKKLQTIPEHNEESLVILEKQLEDCNDLNRSLEEEYKETNKKMIDLQTDNSELLIKIDNFDDTILKLNSTIEQLNKQLDQIELEKCNLIFEINEMKTDDKKSAIDSELTEHKLKITNLEMQLERLNKDHSDLVNAMQSQQNNLIDTKKELERFEKLLHDKEMQIMLRDKDIEKYKHEFELLQTKVIEKSSTEDDKDNSMIIIDQLTSEKDIIEMKLNESLNENIKLIEKLKEFEENFKHLQDNNDLLQDENLKSNDLTNDLNKTIQNINIEKQELIQTIQTKHNENLQYYTEIQRLGQLLQNIEQEKQILLDDKGNCENCKELEKQLKTLKTTFEQQMNKLSEKSDELLKNFNHEQNQRQRLQHDKIELVEQNQTLIKDLERLRIHLVDLEDSHTQETIEMQNIIDETNAKMIELEQTVSKTNTAHTSASIRANQHAETIQAQYSLVNQQRDELAIKLSEAEDRELKNQAALVNLQSALEQFQRAKEKDIETATNRIRKQIQFEKDKQERYQTEINNLKEQLADANHGLLAASRISDQLETSKGTIVHLKDEIEKLQNNSNKLEEKLKVYETSQEDQIEKNLIKSLIIGYLVSNSQNDKSQILKMISSVLNFNQIDNDKIGLNRNQSGWFTGILSAGTHSKDSLAEAFVNFLEKESQPRNDPIHMPNLLNIISAEGSSSSAIGSGNRDNDRNKERKLSSTSSIGSASGKTNYVQPILLNDNILAEHFAPTRNSSSILKDILNDA